MQELAHYMDSLKKWHSVFKGHSDWSHVSFDVVCEASCKLVQLGILGCRKKLGGHQMQVGLTAPLQDVRDALREACLAELKEVAWVN